MNTFFLGLVEITLKMP